MERNISSVLKLTESCISKFENLLVIQSQRRIELLESRLADFSLWADGVGALAKPGASLDSRLHGRLKDLTLVKNVLIMLADSLDYYATLTETDINFNEGIQNLDSAIKNLSLIGVAFHQTGKTLRNRRVDQIFDPDEHQDLREHLECVVLLRPTKEALFRQTKNGSYVAKLDASKLSDLQQRLIQANLRRRHNFLQAQKRSVTQNTAQIQLPTTRLPLSVGNLLQEEAPLAHTQNSANPQDPTLYPITKDKNPATHPFQPTPITGRVSWAKSGVPVHTCDTCQPPKTFTRAEHLRRHQLGHQPPELSCTISDCKKVFHRKDLLDRHLQRHEQEVRIDRYLSRRRRSGSSPARPHNTSPTILGFYLASTAEATTQNATATKSYAVGATKTQITLIASDADFPKAPRIPSDRDIPKCPCCCQLIPTETFSDPKIWKQHVIKDICPYTCIAEKCPAPHLLFCTRDEWETHIKKSHPLQWQCPFCEEQNRDYPTMESMGSHLQNDHKDELRENSLPTLLSWSAVQKIGIRFCPLCSLCGPEDSPELINHVLRHTYEFALRALPWPQPIISDVNEPPGSFHLPKNSDDAENIKRWINEAAHESVGVPELKLCDYDRADHSVQALTNFPEYSDYFLTYEYFNDRSEDESFERQCGQNTSSNPLTVSTGNLETSMSVAQSKWKVRGQPEDDYPVGRGRATQQEGIAKLFNYITLGQLNLVTNFIDQNPGSPNMPNEEGETPLIAAIRADKPGIVLMLLRSKAAVEHYGLYCPKGQKTRVQRTPLQVAAAEGKLEITKILRENRAQPLSVAPDGATALQLAIDFGHQEVLDVLRIGIDYPMQMRV